MKKLSWKRRWRLEGGGLTFGFLRWHTGFAKISSSIQRTDNLANKLFYYCTGKYGHQHRRPRHKLSWVQRISLEISLVKKQLTIFVAETRKKTLKPLPIGYLTNWPTNPSKPLSPLLKQWLSRSWAQNNAVRRQRRRFWSKRAPVGVPELRRKRQTTEIRAVHRLHSHFYSVIAGAALEHGPGDKNSPKPSHQVEAAAEVH